MEKDSSLEELVLELFDVQAVKFGNFTLNSGVASPIYIDLRVIVSYPKLMDKLTDVMAEVIKNPSFGKTDKICGVPYTALPMASLVSIKTGIPMLIRRKEAKEHGLKKIIDGEFSKGEDCLIIEDIISSGMSVITTYEDLLKEGLKVSRAVVVLNREQGGENNIQEKGIKVHTLTTISSMLNLLLQNNKITEETYHEVEQYISKTKMHIIDGIACPVNVTVQNRLTMPFSEREKLTNNKLAAKIFQLMESKKTLLCLAADVTKSCDLLKLASEVGPHICIFKTHFDAVEDFTKKTYTKLVGIAKNCNFLIMEDRKFSDIGNTVCLQYNPIKSWAELVTAHSISGEGIIKALKSCSEDDSEKGCFLVAELSCEGNLINKQYTLATLKMAENYSDFVVGLVCQSPRLIRVPNLIQLTPGVKIEEGSDNLGQNYTDPEAAVLEKGADVAVVGRGITASSNPEKAALIYKERLWDAYQKRVKALTKE